MTRANLVKILGLAALALPFLAMAFMIGINIRQLQNTEYRFAIEGYDPRDLLRGHYLVFQYKWPENTENLCTDKQERNCCACLNDAATSVSFMPCNTAASEKMCHALLPVQKFWNDTFQPHDDLRRYYIPEAYARKLEQMLRDDAHQFEIGIVPHKKGGKVKMLYIDNTPLPQFLTEHSAD